MKKVRNIIKNELIARHAKKEDSFHIVGTEIKDRRLTLSRTLSAISNNICSISYLCKIENNKIIPNKFYLKEICKKLHMQEDKVDALMGLKLTLDDVVKAYLRKDPLFIENAFIKGMGLINYRYKIIEFIYFISIKSLYKANIKANELMRLVSTMLDRDLVIFALFFGVLSFYNQDFLDAIENLNALDKMKIHSEVQLIQIKYKFYSYYMLNSPCCLFIYNDLVQCLFTNGYLNEIDEIRYIMGLYLLRGKYFLEYKKVFRLIRSISYRNSLCLLAKIMISPYLRIKEEWIKNVEPYFYYLGLIRIHPEQAAIEIQKLNDLSFKIDFNLLYLQYYLLPNEVEKYSFICDIALPSIEKTQDGYAKDYFLNELAKLSLIVNKYKFFVEAYKRLKGAL